MKLLFLGDIVGNPGRKAVKKALPSIIDENGIQLCIANGENAAGGVGITHAVANELFDCGIDFITLGNHTWGKKDVLRFIDSEKRIIRPANYPEGVPGKGSSVIQKKGVPIGVVNLQGRIYMDCIDCPFRTALHETDYLSSFTNIIIVDFHAEATSEKCALAWYLDGKVSCVIGTHTHVQTSDERILPEGTAFITDAGMTGPVNGIIGVDRDRVIKKFLTGMPEKFHVTNGSVQINAVIVDIDDDTGRALSIQRMTKVLGSSEF